MTYTNAKPPNRLLRTQVPAPRTDARSDHQLPHAMHAEVILQMPNPFAEISQPPEFRWAKKEKIVCLVVNP